MLLRLLIPATIIFVVILIINIFLMKLTNQMVTDLLANPQEYHDYYHAAHHGYSGYLPGPSVPIQDAKDTTKTLYATGLGHFYH